MILGEHDRSSNAENIQVMKVGKVGDHQLLVSWRRLHHVCSPIITMSFSFQVFKHPRYNGFTINNDILLIKLASPAQMNVRVSPVCAAETGDDFPGGMKCVTSGWGLTRHNGESTWPIRGEWGRGL